MVLGKLLREFTHVGKLMALMSEALAWDLCSSGISAFHFTFFLAMKLAHSS